MAMRIIAGRLKGRRLKAPAWDGLRPTSDKLRETLFNILAPRIDGARVLDGYAGTGAVGIEALSRGAAHVTFVEQDRRAVALIEANLSGLRRGGGLYYPPWRCRHRVAGPGRERVRSDPAGSAVRHHDHDRRARRGGSGACAWTVWWCSSRRRAVNQSRAASLEPMRDVKSGDSTLTFFTHASVRRTSWKDVTCLARRPAASRSFPARSIR